jgi:hypothetical protein
MLKVAWQSQFIFQTLVWNCNVRKLRYTDPRVLSFGTPWTKASSVNPRNIPQPPHLETKLLTGALTATRAEEAERIANIVEVISRVDVGIDLKLDDGRRAAEANGMS